MTFYTINSLSAIFKFKEEATGFITRPRMISCRDLSPLQEERMIATATRALTNINLTYESDSKKVTFKASSCQTSSSPQLYYVGISSLQLISKSVLKSTSKDSPFKEIDQAIGKFFVEGYCYVHSDLALENVHLWLHTLINDFQNIYEKDPELFTRHKIAFPFLNELFILFYENIYWLTHTPVFDTYSTKPLNEYMDESVQRAFVSCLKHLNDAFLELYQSKKKLEGELAIDEPLEERQKEKLATLKLIDQAMPHLLKILVGFHASWSCNYIQIGTSPTLSDRAYAASYTAESVFKQAIQLTVFINNARFMPLKSGMLADNLPEEATQITSYLNSKKIWMFSIKPEVDELISTISTLELPLTNRSQKIYERALVHFFTQKKLSEFTCFAEPLARAYFHLVYPKNVHIKPQHVGEFGFLDNDPYPMLYANKSELEFTLLSLLDSYLSDTKKIPERVKEDLNTYLKNLSHILSSMAQSIRGPDTAVLLGEHSRPFLEKTWTEYNQESDLALIIGHCVASDLLKEFSEICERVNEELNIQRQELVERSKKWLPKERLKAEAALDEICQLFLKNSTKLLINPNFLGKLLYYIKKNGLHFEGEGSVILEIDSDNVDSIIRSLIHLGIAPASFLDLFNWRVANQSIAKKEELELAQLIVVKTALTPPIKPKPQALAASELPVPTQMLSTEEADPTRSGAGAPPLEETGAGTVLSKLTSSYTITQTVKETITSSKATEKGKYPHTTFGFAVKTDRSADGARSSNAARSDKAKSPPALYSAPEEIREEKSLTELIEELNSLMRSGVKTSKIFNWLKVNDFEYDRHSGSHAIYMYNGHHVSIRDKLHLNLGLLRALRDSIVGVFSKTTTAASSKKSPHPARKT